MHHLREILVVAVICAASISAATVAPKAMAIPASPPFQSNTCVSSGCSFDAGSGTYGSGGGGASISDQVMGPWGSGASTVIGRGVLERLLWASASIPKPVYAFGTIFLGLAALDLGWRIGSTLNSQYLHVLGYGLGTNGTFGAGGSGACSAGSAITGKWIYNQYGLWGSGYHNQSQAPGWVLHEDDFCAGNRVEFHDDHGTSADAKVSESQYLWASTTGGEFVDDSRGAGWYFRFIPADDIYDYLVFDGGLQPYTGQPYGISTGWRVAGGCGDVSAACSYPGGQTNPVLSVAALRCMLTGDSADCGSGLPAICVRSDGTPYYGGAGSTGCGLGEGPQNLLNCRVDPADYYCPTATSSGHQFGSAGGAAGPMPDCYGFELVDCENAVLAARPDVAFSVSVAGGDDPNVASDLVVGTSPSAGSPVPPVSVGITQNTSNGRPKECTWQVDSPHVSKGTPDAVDVKARSTCTYSTTVHATLTLWRCDDTPNADLAALTGGDWGCMIPSIDSSLPFVRAMYPGDEEVFQVPPPTTGTIVPADGSFFIASGTNDKANPTLRFSPVSQP